MAIVVPDLLVYHYLWTFDHTEWKLIGYGPLKDLLLMLILLAVTSLPMRWPDYALILLVQRVELDRDVFTEH